MKTVHVFGNPYLEGDSFACQVADELKGFDIVRCRSPEELMEHQDTITILDVVKGASEPLVITDIEKLKTRNMVSMHDFDLGFFLKLMKKMGMQKKVKIIGIPEKGDSVHTAQEVERCIRDS